MATVTTEEGKSAATCQLGRWQAPALPLLQIKIADILSFCDAVGQWVANKPSLLEAPVCSSSLHSSRAGHVVHPKASCQLSGQQHVVALAAVADHLLQIQQVCTAAL